MLFCFFFVFFQAEDGIRDLVRSRGLGDVYKRQVEWDTLRCNFSTSNKRGGTRYMPFAFTEQDVSMLSSILNSDKAIDVNILIMRTFVLMLSLIHI